MDVKGLDMSQISKIIEVYLNEYFTGCVVVTAANGIFSEVIRLAFDEIDHLIPVDQMQYFQGTEWFNGASGFVEVSNTDDGITESNTVILLLYCWMNTRPKHCISMSPNWTRLHVRT